LWSWRADAVSTAAFAATVFRRFRAGAVVVIVTVQVGWGVYCGLYVFIDHTGYDIVFIVAVDYDAMFPSVAGHVGLIFSFSPNAHTNPPFFNVMSFRFWYAT
jgi:hypothetical protein